MSRFGKLLIGIAALMLVALASMVRFGATPVLRQAELEASRQMAPPSPGALRIPVAGVRADQLVDSFADARGVGTRGHGAIDIPAPRGTPVLAAAPGTLEKLFDSTAGGHTLYVRLDGGQWQHYYAHLDRYAEGLREGLHVNTGETIAYVGSTGDASAEAPHLHFEIHRMAPGDGWWQGAAVNPYPLLAAAR